MADLIVAMLEAGDDTQLALGVGIGFAFAMFTGLMWLRVFRWVFALFGLRA